MKDKLINENSKHLNIILPIIMYNSIKELADKSERTISHQVRYMLQQYLEIATNK